MMGDKIGSMVIMHEVLPDSTEHYIMETKSKATVLWIKKENYTRYDVRYKNNKLIASEAKEIENGELKSWANVSIQGGKYFVNSDWGKFVLKQIPDFSVVTLFFKGPGNNKTIFYEAEAEFDDLIQTEPGTWQFKSSDGHTNIYHFTNNKIDRVEFHVSIATIKLVRTK
jgi:hypothetical protein